jgi:TRAP-type transport system periplasmic protein
MRCTRSATDAVAFAQLAQKRREESMTGRTLLTSPRRNLLLGLSFAAALFASVSTVQAQTWKCYTYMPSATHPVYVGLQNIAKAVEKISNGKITVNCNVGGSLPFKSEEIASALSAGILNIVTSGFDSGYVPVSGIFSVPGLFSSEAELDKGYQAAFPILESEYAKRGIVVLGPYHYPRQVIWSTTEMKSVDGLKGAKVRVNSPENAEFIKRFGGTPVTVATPDVAPSLQRGVFSGVITAAAGAGQLWIDMLRFMVDVGPSYTVSLALINKANFEALSADQQKALRAAVLEESTNISNQMRQQNEQLLDKFVKGGFKIAAGTPAQEKDVQERMKPYWTEWASQRGEAATAALKAVRDALGK